MDARSVALHEFGHLVGFLHHDVPVVELVVRPSGGHCRSDGMLTMSPGDRIVCILMGCLSASMLGGTDLAAAVRSSGDDDLLRRAEDDHHAATGSPLSAQQRRFLDSQARDLVLGHEGTIKYGVAHLLGGDRTSGSMFVADLARLCHEPLSPFAVFKHLYVKPAKQPTPVPVAAPTPKPTPTPKGKHPTGPERIVTTRAMSGGGVTMLVPNW